MRYINILILGVLNLSCFNQDNQKAWISEEYVNSITSNDSTIENFLSPIEGFEFFDSSYYILMYKGELQPLNLKKVIIDGKQKYQILDLEYLVNLKYNSREIVNRLSNSKIFLSEIGNKLKIEIIENENIQIIYFVDRYCDYIFKDIKDTKNYLIEIQSKNKK